MNNNFKFIILIILLSILVIPQAVFAATFPFEGPLIPCGTEDNPEKCTLCHFFLLGQNIINLLLFILVAVAPLIIIFGAIIIITSGGSPEQATKGKKAITYTVIGLLIAFGSWIVINTVINKLVDPGAMPWPWNQPECGTIEPGETHLECVEDKCKEVAGAGYDQCQTDAECVEEEIEEIYCICDIPVYSYSNESSVLGRKIQATELADQDTCNDQCITDNYANYCLDNSLTDESTESDLACVSKKQLEQQDAYCSSMEYVSDVKFFGSFSSREDCMNSITPDNKDFNSEYANLCWVDGQLYCECADRGSIGYRLYQTYKEISVGTFLNAYSCIRNCGNYTKGACVWGTFQEPEIPSEPPEEEVEWRFQWDLDGTKDQQKDDASTALSNFLDCFYEKTPGENIGLISSITDIDIYKDRGDGFCDPQECKEESCNINICGPGNPCDHSCGSCHYGGECNTTKSYAVDFGDQQNACQIADAALQCDGVNAIYGPESCGGKITPLASHDNHVHISVINSCNCN